MLSPLVVIIMLAGCALAGLYFGYKNYKAIYNKDIIKKGQKQLVQDLEDRTKELSDLMELRKKRSELTSQKPKVKKNTKPLLLSLLKDHRAPASEPIKSSQFNIIFFPKTIRRPRIKYAPSITLPASKT